jgi:hypothetical protein
MLARTTITYRPKGLLGGARPTIEYLRTREEWLMAASGRLRSLFEEKGFLFPPSLRVSCGWPLRAQRLSRGGSHAIGQCWPQRASEDGSHEIFISPQIDDPCAVLATLVHELVHAADDCQNGHRGPFRKMAISLGLSGPMRSTCAGPELRERLNVLSSHLGQYPHARLDGTQLNKKKATRLIKVVCERSSCRYAFWTTRMWLDVGTPTCVCGSRMSEIARRM